MRPRPPASLSGEALEEWRRVVDELEALDQVDATDRAIVLLYCKAWQRWSDAQAQVDDLGLMVAAPKTKVPMANPYLAIANKAHEQCAGILDALGLTPVARARLAKLRAQPREAEQTELVF